MLQPSEDSPGLGLPEIIKKGVDYRHYNRGEEGEVARPPITATAIGARDSTPAAAPSAIGSMPKIIAKVVISIGRVISDIASPKTFLSCWRLARIVICYEGLYRRGNSQRAYPHICCPVPFYIDIDLRFPLFIGRIDIKHTGHL